MQQLVELKRIDDTLVARCHRHPGDWLVAELPKRLQRLGTTYLQARKSMGETHKMLMGKLAEIGTPTPENTGDRRKIFQRYIVEHARLEAVEAHFWAAVRGEFSAFAEENLAIVAGWRLMVTSPTRDCGNACKHCKCVVSVYRGKDFSSVMNELLGVQE